MEAVIKQIFRILEYFWLEIQERLWSFLKLQGWRSYVFFRQGGVRTMWYVIQTVTGKEEELMLFIRTLLNREHFENCFVIRAEWLKRLGGDWQVQIRPLFPGYVFIETDEPERIYMELKRVPRFSRLLGSGKDEFIPVKAAEEEFLRVVMGGWEGYNDAVVGLTNVKTDEEGNVISIEGALSCFERENVKVNLHKRYAVVKTSMLGEERTLIFGIRLDKDKRIR